MPNCQLFSERKMPDKMFFFYNCTVISLITEEDIKEYIGLKNVGRPDPRPIWKQLYCIKEMA